MTGLIRISHRMKTLPQRKMKRFNLSQNRIYPPSGNRKVYQIQFAVTKIHLKTGT